MNKILVGQFPKIYIIKAFFFFSKIKRAIICLKQTTLRETKLIVTRIETKMGDTRGYESFRPFFLSFSFFLFFFSGKKCHRENRRVQVVSRIDIFNNEVIYVQVMSGHSFVPLVVEMLRRAEYPGDY